MQDVDTAFLNKSNLEANVDALAQEVEFLKALYLEVRLVFSRHSRMRVLSLHALEAESGLWVSSAGFPQLVPLLLRPACSLSVTLSGGMQKVRDFTRHLHSHVRPDTDHL